MGVDIRKNAFSTEEVHFIIEKLEQAEARGYISIRSENNLSLMASYQGRERMGISSSWNVKIYTYNRKKKGHSIVCVDLPVLLNLIEEDYAQFIPPDLEVLRIDDAGWGFPLCGVMVGVSDERIVRSAIVPEEYFKIDSENSFSTKQYLEKYTELGIQLLEQFAAKPETHRIEICSGYVNQPLKDRLRGLGFDVRVVKIRGLLQEQLESRFRQHVYEELGADIYYDPKGLQKSEIARRYYQCLSFGKQHFPGKVKTGWGAIAEAQMQKR